MKSKYYTLPLLSLFALAATLFPGCMKDSTDSPNTSGMLTIGYTVDGMQAGTYSTPAEGHELAVNDIHILFYELAENSGGGGYVTYQHATLTHGTSTFSFPIPDALVAKTDYRTLIVGNAHSFVPSGYASFDAYLNACKSMTFDEAKQKIHAEMAGRSMSVLPMWGKFVDGTGAEIPFRFESRTSASIIGTIHLSRSVCRLDLKNNAANSLNIAWVKVCNYRSKGYYFHNDVSYGDINPGLSSAPPSGMNDGYVRVSEPSNGIQELKAGLYAFSNAVPVVAQNDDHTTYLMIAGYYQDGSTPNTTKLTYYRFNMAELGGSQLLKRNYVYRASIMSVKGAGADSEQGAKDESSPLLEYQVDDEWEEDEDDTATDEFGNFLILSRTQVTFSEGVKDETEVVKVKVKEGMTWEVIADHTPTDRPDAFSFAKASGASFSITTLLDNASEQAFGGRLKVVATTPQNTKLELSVSLTQFSSADEMNILLVDGRNGTISKRIPGSGATLSLQVQTGSRYARWIVEDDGNSFGAWSGSSFTGAGADNGNLTIVAAPNITPAERTATLIVHRTGAADVIINLTQPKSDKLLTITPMPANGILTLEGFNSATGNPNGLSAQQEFWVILADPSNYTVTVTSDFDSNHDLQLSQSNALPAATAATFPGTPATSTLAGMPNGVRFWLNAFRTGPGDPTIKGTITVKAVPNTADLETQEISFTVHIVTSCTIGDVVIGSNLVADRNVGTISRIDNSGGFIPALNYSYDTNLHIKGYANDDSKNTQFIGQPYAYNQITTAAYSCAKLYADKNVDDEGVYSPYYKSADRDKWKYPKDEIETFGTRMVFSKLRAFLVSDLQGTQGKNIGCFFPIEKLSGTMQGSLGRFDEGLGNFRNYYLVITPYKTTYTSDRNNLNSAYLQRCIRPVE